MPSSRGQGKPGLVGGGPAAPGAWRSFGRRAAIPPNKPLQQTGAAVRLSEVFCLPRGPGF